MFDVVNSGPSKVVKSGKSVVKSRPGKEENKR